MFFQLSFAMHVPESVDKIDCVQWQHSQRLEHMVLGLLCGPLLGIEIVRELICSVLVDTFP